MRQQTLRNLVRSEYAPERTKKAHGPKAVRLQHQMERKKGFEPSTPSLARRCSTAELLPRSYGSIAVAPLFDNDIRGSTTKG